MNLIYKVEIRGDRDLVDDFTNQSAAFARRHEGLRPGKCRNGWETDYFWNPDSSMMHTQESFIFPSIKSGEAFRANVLELCTGVSRKRNLTIAVSSAWDIAPV